MAYNKKNHLEKIIEIQDIALSKNNLGIPFTVIYRDHIKDQYYISYSTFNNYLSRNAKKELEKLEDMDADHNTEIFKQSVYDMYIQNNAPLKDIALKLNLSYYAVIQIIKNNHFDEIKKQNRFEVYKAKELEKEQKEYDKFKNILHIQNIRDMYTNESVNNVYIQYIKPRYKISIHTFKRYLITPAIEKVIEIDERRKCREIADKERIKQTEQSDYGI